MCIFCDVSEHESENCSRPLKMTYEQRKEFVKSKRGCLSCLKIGHVYWKCKNKKLNCEFCSRHHVSFMCPVEHKNKESDKSSTSKNCAQMRNEVNCFAGTADCPMVFLQTVRAKLINNDKEMIVRVLFDSGSQHSYIKKSIASRMGYQPLGEFQMNHLLFGGTRKESIVHTRYSARLRSLNNDFTCNFIAIDSDVICEDVPIVSKNIWCEELQNLNIQFSDFSGDGNSVTVLIGSDIGGKLETGRIHQLKCGLTAKETLLGWTLSGKHPGRNKNNSSITAISMFTQSLDIENLWSLDVMSIKDPIMQ